MCVCHVERGWIVFVWYSLGQLNSPPSSLKLPSSRFAGIGEMDAGDGGRCEFLLNSLTHDGAHLKFKRSVIDDDFCKLQIGV